MDKIDKRNFYTGAVFLILAVFVVSLLPMILRALDFIFIFNASQFKDLSMFLVIISLVFWLNCEGYFKKQVALVLLLALFFILTVGLNFVFQYP